MAEHYKTICKQCGILMGQCRCMDKNKVVLYDICENCKQKTKTTRLMTKIEEAITDFWGSKCDDFNEDCPCCQAWREYEDLVVSAGGRLEELQNFRYDNEKQGYW